MPRAGLSSSQAKRIILRSGRALAWTEWGSQTCIPVIFCTGAGMSGSLGVDATVLSQHNVRLLAVDRPGLGRSAPHASKTLSSWVEDINELIEQQSLQHPLAVGYSQGAPFALALAAKGSVHATAIVSGTDDLGHPRVKRLLPTEVAGMVEAARRDRESFVWDVARIATPDWLWGMVMNMSAECDRALYQNGRFGEQYLACLREGFAQGAEGYAQDLANAFGEWTFALESITGPVDLWFGRQDTSPVHSPDFGETLASRLPNASLTVDDRLGSAILWQRTADILAKLVSHRPDA